VVLLRRAGGSNVTATACTMRWLGQLTCFNALDLSGGGDAAPAEYDTGLFYGAGYLAATGDGSVLSVGFDSSSFRQGYLVAVLGAA
jgi:hypothetical protein